MHEDYPWKTAHGYSRVTVKLAEEKLKSKLFHSPPARVLIMYISRVSDQKGVSLLYIMLEIHHSGREPSIYCQGLSDGWRAVNGSSPDSTTVCSEHTLVLHRLAKQDLDKIVTCQIRTTG